MTTLDDKLLGEKTHYYCSSSSEDDDDGEVEQTPGAQQPSSHLPPLDDWQGSATNTGPKGVLTDFQRWKQLDSERRAENDQERLELIKKLSITCQTESEEEASKAKDAEVDKEIEDLLQSSDDIMKEFIQKRMEELVSLSSPTKRFGGLIKCLNGNDFLSAIEKESPQVTIICHVYSFKSSDCIRLNDAINILARNHATTKFISIEVSTAGMSAHFEEKGCPAILVYKSGNLIGNFVRISDNLDSDYDAEDVEGFLIEHGFLTDAKCSIISSKFRGEQVDSDDDDD